MCVDTKIFILCGLLPEIVNLAILWTGHMADPLKCIFCKFQHVVVVQYTKQCFIEFHAPGNMCVDTKIFILR